ncbi:MAG: hypothetical protein B7Y15_12405 [Bacteroidetes bacterium 24-39-8]|jgi:transcriptional regulator with XRE-family HTH domain|nr:MAG: hypothetical protein B7Y15_12405 [Bacteroidetes bacterium 24-39-8]OZA66753.1 MAG: hypothetical protein B7X72_05105 [Sphingobacteriia bacterium 39-39-8]HQR93978.1 helix-turn-helix transcriptional regulator [Sediminibacterium sp.]HQS53752.1 helix-turn-helix transcriptional regulator [Sediminibacterium sp.]
MSMMNEHTAIQWHALSDQALLELLGNFIKETRLSQNLTQEQLANQAGIARSTLSLLEKGSGGTILCLIQVLRILDQLSIFKQLQRPVQVRPLLLAKQAKTQRKRASNKQSNDPLSTNADW